MLLGPYRQNLQQGAIMLITRTAFVLAALALVAAVPLPKHRAHSTDDHATAMTAAAAADLITVLPGAPNTVSFKQYAGG